MAKQQFTEKAIGEAMKALMQQKPFREITVQEIVDKSGVSHKTFYYHFRDKYDLVNRIFHTEVMEDILAHTRLEHWEEGSLVLCRHVLENRDFYTNAIHVEGQNSLREYFHLLTEQQVTLLCSEICGASVLPPEHLRFLITFYYGAFVELFSAWVQGGMKETPEALVERWKILVGTGLETYVKRYSIPGADG